MKPSPIPATPSRRLFLRFGRRVASADCWRRAIRGAQVSPVHVRAKLFAADNAASSTLDGRAVLCGNIPSAPPVIDNLLHDTKLTRKLGLRSAVLFGFDKSFHATIIKHVGIACQHVVFASTTICFRLPSWH